mgnify:CR=1 FL=1
MEKKHIDLGLNQSASLVFSKTKPVGQRFIALKLERVDGIVNTDCFFNGETGCIMNFIGSQLLGDVPKMMALIREAADNYIEI